MAVVRCGARYIQGFATDQPAQRHLGSGQRRRAVVGFTGGHIKRFFIHGKRAVGIAYGVVGVVKAACACGCAGGDGVAAGIAVGRRAGAGQCDARDRVAVFECADRSGVERGAERQRSAIGFALVSGLERDRRWVDGQRGGGVGNVVVTGLKRAVVGDWTGGNGVAASVGCVAYAARSREGYRA